MRTFLVAVSTLVLIACGAGDSGDPDFITGGPDCSECSIELAGVTTLRSSQPAGGPRYPATVVKLGDSYALAPTWEPGTAAVFGGDGQLTAVLGRFGDGPGEMKDVKGITRWFGDSIAVLHDRSRVSVFDEGLEHARTLTLQSSSFITTDISPSGDSILLGRRTGTAGGADVALRYVSATGEPLRGYGPSTDLGAGRIYAAFVEAGDTVWAADMRRYEIDVFSRVSGRLLATIEREVEWFPPDTRTDWGGQPEIRDFVRFAPGKFLVLLIRPRSDFTLPAVRRSTGPETAATRQLDHAGMLERYEQILELLDLESGKVIAQLDVTDRWLGGFIKEDEVFSYEEDPRTGEIAVGVWRIEISGLSDR